MFKRFKWLVLICMFLSSSFMINTIFIEEGSAKVCPIGSYPVKVSENGINDDKTINWECKSTDSQGTDVTAMLCDEDGNPIGEDKSGLASVKCKAEKIDKYIETFALGLIGMSSGIAVLMIVYSGILYVISAGDPKLIRQAKLQLVAAAVGLFIAGTAITWMKIIESLSQI